MMNLKTIGIATLITSSFVCLSLAEDRHDPRPAMEQQSIATEKSPESYSLAARSTAKAAEGESVVAATSEVFQEIVIPPGKNVFLDSTMDYTASNTVAITVQCIICNSAVTALGASGLLIQARWMVPEASTYVTTENKTTTAFPYWDAGGVIFNVYGTQFRLSLQNRGSQTIAVQQITVFRRSQ